MIDIASTIKNPSLRATVGSAAISTYYPSMRGDGVKRNRTKQSTPNLLHPNMERGGYIYILTNKNHTVLYTGVTSNLANRIYEHRTGLYKTSFTHKYNVKELVYYEELTSIEEAIFREKQIKAGSRQKKLDMIFNFNPGWKDLSGNFL